MLLTRSGLRIHESPAAGDVTVTYHTYHGFFAWFTQTHHHVSLPPEQARILLGRLLRFNLTWGLFTEGMTFIPPLAVWNYFAQCKSIGSQEAGNAFATINASDVLGDRQRNPYDSPQMPSNTPVPTRSFFHTAIGWICAFLCLLFGITTVTCFVRAEFKPAIGVLFATAILGWTSWNWLHKHNRPLQD